MNTKRVYSIDIIKGIAMLMVILVHYNQSFTSNIPFFSFFQMGCQLFFVTSGFCAAKSFDRMLTKSSCKRACISFYWSRYKSIAPAYYFMIVVVYLVNSLAIYLTGSTISFGFNRKPLNILCNFLFIHGLVPDANNTVMAGGWYIGTTMLLYLITPIFFLILQKTKYKRLLCAVSSLLSLSLLFIISLILPHKEGGLFPNNSFGYFSILTQFPCFCLGILLYFENKEPYYTNTAQITYLIKGCIFFILAIILFFNPFSKYSYIIDVSLVGLAIYFILKYMLYYEEMHDYHILFTPLTSMGRKSLYIYLAHPFFAWTFVTVIKRILSYFGLMNDTYFLYFTLMPIVILLSYLFGCVLQKILKSTIICFQTTFRDNYR